MEFKDYFLIWDKLTAQQQQKISHGVIRRTVKKGTVIHNGSMDCTGFLLVKDGQLRAYILSDEGREITIYRLPELARNRPFWTVSFLLQRNLSQRWRVKQEGTVVTGKAHR